MTERRDEPVASDADDAAGSPVLASDPRSLTMDRGARQPGSSGANADAAAAEPDAE